MTSSNIWLHATEEELVCWSGISHKLRNPEYTQKKSEYWRKFLDYCGVDLEKLNSSRILEIGCGPSGIFMLLPHHQDMTIVDPLLHEYKNLAPENFGAQTVVSSKFEDFSDDRKFDIVFAVNCIDHCDDINMFVTKLAELSRGEVYLAVNTHERSWTQKIWKRYQQFLEPHHPYHFTADGYAELFSAKFDVVKTVDIEDIVIWVNKETSDKKFPDPDHNLTKKVNSKFDRIKEAFRDGQLFQVVVAKSILKLFETFVMPEHDTTGAGKSIYRHKLFVLRPKSST